MKKCVIFLNVFWSLKLPHQNVSVNEPSKFKLGGIRMRINTTSQGNIFGSEYSDSVRHGLSGKPTHPYISPGSNFLEHET
jgi:hypothetical protein